jgi:hypothetical protein
MQCHDEGGAYPAAYVSPTLNLVNFTLFHNDESPERAIQIIAVIQAPVARVV